MHKLCVVLGLLALLCPGPLAVASILEDPNASGRLAPRREALEALGAFRHAFRARGQKGEEKLYTQRAALIAFSKVNHPIVADHLLKVAVKARGAEVRTMAIVELGAMKALPSYAGERLVSALGSRSIRKDAISVRAIVQGFLDLPYLPSPKVWKDLFKHSDLPVQKKAIDGIARLGDSRMIEELIAMLAVCDRAEVGSGPSAAGGVGGASTGGGAGTGGGAAGGGRRSRRFMGRTKLRQNLVEALEKLTGQEFERAAQATQWVAAHPKEVHALTVKLSARLTEQAQLLRESKAWAKLRR